MPLGVIKSGAARLAFRRAGQGTPVVLSHAGIADQRSWEPQVAELSKDHDVITWDRRGFGATPRPREDLAHVDDLLAHVDDLLAHVDDLLALVDGLGLDDVHLVGCSQGGKISIDFALTHPTRVRSLSLVCSALGGHEHEGDWPAVAYEIEAIEETGDLQRINELEIELWVVGRGRTRADLPSELLQLCLDMNGKALAAPEFGRERELNPPAIARLQELCVPTLVVTAELDVEAT